MVGLQSWRLALDKQAEEQERREHNQAAASLQLFLGSLSSMAEHRVRPDRRCWSRLGRRLEDRSGGLGWIDAVERLGASSEQPTDRGRIVAGYETKSGVGDEVGGELSVQLSATNEASLAQ